ncbi:stage III sporulation protein AF [Gracilibacillus sp. Marseille-QA3620]
MSFLTTWVTNIIVFILFAVVLDMLLPNSSMQKYTKLVVGLLLTAIFLTPILTLLKQDFTSDIQHKIMSNGVWGNQEMENSLESKKKEIEETQQAYILEQMAVQLKSEAEKELTEGSGYEIKDVEIRLINPKGEMKEENIESIHVTLVEQSKEEAEGVQPVEKVDIDLEEQQSLITAPSPQIQEILSEKWGVSSSKLIIEINEGGDGL